MTKEKLKEYEIELLGFVRNGVSNCCSAKVYGDLCANCRDHCEIIIEEETK